jgi:gamma-carbonic anhydrase
MALILPVRNCMPSFGENCFLAPNATIVGEVIMGDYCSVWFGAVVRGDVHYIKIGNHTNIQDNVTIHGTYQTAPTNIGNYVTIGHNAVVHGCTLEDHCLIGMGARILDNARVETGAIVAAGAVVLENTVVESGWIYAGVPAKKVKQVGDRKEMIERIGKNYIKYASWFKEQTSPPNADNA